MSKKKKQNIKPFIISGIIFLSIYISVAVYLHSVGEWGPTANARLVEMNICLDDLSYTPVKNISLPQDSVYLCGVVDGTTKYFATFYTYQANKVIYHDTVKLNPGVFFTQISGDKKLIHGNYRVVIQKGRLVLGEVEFVILEP
ncbi:MAG: hypothetical protein AAF639_33010 [Chloroflexota bacterium]